MDQEKISFSKTFTFAGTTIAYGIGAGFATAQEIMQYFVAYGWRFLFVVTISISILIYANYHYIKAGAEGRVERSNQIFSYFCGKKIGVFYGFFATIFCFLTYLLMCGGASSILNQAFGVPQNLGAVLFCAIVVTVVLSGLNGIVRIMGKFGPFIILLILFIGISTLFRDGGNIASGVAKVENGSVELIAVGSNIFSASLSYAGFIILAFAIFMTELGRKNGSKNVIPGMCIGSLASGFTLIIMSLALFSNITEVAGTSIPSLILAEKISPLFAQIFSFVIFIGACTSSMPLLWTASSLFPKRKDKTSPFVVLALGIGGMLISCLFSYPALVNAIYGYCGYIGIFLLVFLIATPLRARWRAARAKAQPSE